MHILIQKIQKECMDSGAAVLESTSVTCGVVCVCAPRSIMCRGVSVDGDDIVSFVSSSEFFVHSRNEHFIKIIESVKSYH